MALGELVDILTWNEKRELNKTMGIRQRREQRIE